MKSDLKREAITLRKKGRSIKSIAKVLHVSSGSVSRWCANIELTPPQRNRLVAAQQKAALKALAPWIERNREMKIADVRKQEAIGKKDVAKLSRRELLVFGLGLYWGEGYKRGSQEWGFTNCDPAIIRTMLTWLRICYGVDRKRIIARLTLNARYAYTSEYIRKTWATETDISLAQFGPDSYISGYGKSTLPDRTYRGTLRIKVRKGISLRRRILASITDISGQISPSSWKTFS